MAEKKTEKKADKKVAKAAAKRERKPSALRRDHIKVIEFLGKDLPKRTSFKMADIAKAKFKDGPNITADRVARNSVRKPRELGLVEIAERGEYRLTPQGATFHKNLKTYQVAPDIEREEKVAKKAAKAAKAAKPAKAAKAEKPAKAKAAAKPAAEKPAKKPAAKKVAKPAKAKPAVSDPDFPEDPEEKAAATEPAAPLPSDEEEPALNA